MGERPAQRTRSAPEPGDLRRTAADLVVSQSPPKPVAVESYVRLAGDMRLVQELRGPLDGQAWLALVGSTRTCTEFADEIPVELTGPPRVDLQRARVSVTMDWRFSTGGLSLPSIAAPFIPDIVPLRWEQTLVLEPQGDRLLGSITVATTSGTSATFNGSALLQLAPAPAGAVGPGSSGPTTYTVEGKASVSVPFVGGKLGGLVEEHLVGHVIRAQVAVIQRLAGSNHGG